MAKRFVKVIGLYNIFVVSNNILDITSIRLDVQEKVNYDSIVFLTATEEDEQYGYPNGSKYIWVHGEQLWTEISHNS